MLASWNSTYRMIHYTISMWFEIWNLKFEIQNLKRKEHTEKVFVESKRSFEVLAQNPNMMYTYNPIIFP